MTAVSLDSPKLIRPGKCAVLVLDEGTLAALGIELDTPIAFRVVGRQLIVEAAPAANHALAFREAMTQTVQENEDLFRRLAK